MSRQQEPRASQWRSQDPEGWTIRDITIAEVERLILSARKPVEKTHAVVFDLDGTLFDVTHRSFGIFDAWLEHGVSETFSDAVIARLRNMEFRHMGYSVKDSFHNLGLDVAHPEVAPIYESVRKWWQTRFFDGKTLLIYDKPLPGAVAFVQRLREQGFHLVYLSGRLRKVMTEGTRLQLRNAGFPVEGCSLVLKESLSTEDAHFKPVAFAELAEKWNVVANFENEYVNLGAMAASHADCVHVVVDSAHSDKPVLPLATPVYRVPGFL